MIAVYTITNLENGKFYVGSSVNVRTRFRTHRRELRKGIHHCEPLQRAWNKYGGDRFKFEVIEEFTSPQDMHDAENRWLTEHYGKPHCYNTGTRAGAAFLGRSHSDSARAAVSAAHKGKKMRLGQKNSPDHRQKISAAMKGKPKSPAHVEKIRQRMIGTSYCKGRVVTDEQRAAKGRAVVELTTGLEFITVTYAAAHFGLERANLTRTLRTDGKVKRGPNAGLHFSYLAEPKA